MEAFEVLGLLSLMTVLASCGGAGRNGDDDDGSGGSDANPPAVKRIFVTKTSHDGNLGGLAGGDGMCGTAATAANLDGIWKAWLSDDSTNAIDRIEEVGPWYLVTGEKAFNNKANLTTGPIVAIDKDELGGASGLQGYFFVWTGTLPSGTRAPDHCLNWTSNAHADIGQYGDRGRNDSGWTDATAWGPKPCDSPLPIYCIEQ